jgi:hypothetical protein
MSIGIVQDLLSLVEKFGLSLVILIVLLVWLKPKIDAIWGEYSASRNIRELTAKQQKALNVDNILHFDLKVKALLDELKDQIECDWVQLWQFHDGIYSMGLPHIPFLFMSITHEVTSNNVMPMSMVYRSLPTTFFKDAANKFTTEDVVITTLSEDSNNISKTFALGGLSNCLLPIRNGEGCLAAILSVGYSAVHPFSSAEKISMTLAAQRLGIYLSTVLIEATETTEGLNKH